MPQLPLLDEDMADKKSLGQIVSEWEQQYGMERSGVPAAKPEFPKRTGNFMDDMNSALDYSGQHGLNLSPHNDAAIAQAENKASLMQNAEFNRKLTPKEIAIIELRRKIEKANYRHDNAAFGISKEQWEKLYQGDPNTRRQRQAILEQRARENAIKEAESLKQQYQTELNSGDITPQMVAERYYPGRQAMSESLNALTDENRRKLGRAIEADFLERNADMKPGTRGPKVPAPQQRGKNTRYLSQEREKELGRPSSSWLDDALHSWMKEDERVKQEKKIIPFEPNTNDSSKPVGLQPGKLIDFNDAVLAKDARDQEELVRNSTLGMINGEPFYEYIRRNSTPQADSNVISLEDYIRSKRGGK